MAKVMIKVIEQQGTCVANHKVGDVFIQENEMTFGGFCSAAYNAIQPYIVALLYGADFPYKTPEGSIVLRCPDPHNRLVVELSKIE